MKTCPELATPATPARPRTVGRPNAAFRLEKSVGIAMRKISELRLRGLFPRCVRFAPTSRPASGNTRYWPVCSTLARREFHPLDFIKRFHRLIFGSSSSKFYLARLPGFPEHVDAPHLVVQTVKLHALDCLAVRYRVLCSCRTCSVQFLVIQQSKPPQPL